MRLTKRQLKTIIREEYSRLKRRGLIVEMGPVSAEDMADFEYDESGAAEEYSSEVQKAVSEAKNFLQKRQARNLEFIEFMLNDFFMRLSRGCDEFLGEFYGRDSYEAGKVLEETDTPFKLTEINRYDTRHIKKVVEKHGFDCSWSFSWE